MVTTANGCEIVSGVFVTRRLLCAVGAAVLVVPVAADASSVTSLSDTVSTPSLPSLTSLVRSESGYLQSLYCKAPAQKRSTLTLAAAVERAKSYVANHSSAAARHQFARTSAAKSERGSLTAGTTAAAADSLVGALNAFLHAHALAPRDPMPLIDSAPLLTDASKPDEALAFLAAAAKLRPPAHQPWGIGTGALIANNRGYALLALNAWKDAQTALTEASKAAPQLSEARLNLAVADLCRNQPSAAARMMFFGARRDPGVTQDLVTSKSGTPTPTQAGIDVLHGKTITLPTYTWPQDMTAGNAMAIGVRDEMVAVESREDDLITQVNQLEQQLTSQLQTANSATRRRTNDLVMVAEQAIVDPTIAPLSDKRLALEQQLDDISTQVLGQQAICSGGSSLHSNWLGLLEQYDKAVRAEVGAEYRLETAAGASLRSGTAHELVMTHASEWAQTLLAGLLQQANFLTMWDDQCTPDIQPGDGDPTDDPTDNRPPSAACPSGLDGRGWQINLGPVQVSLDCNTIGAEIDTGGWIGAFGNVSHNFRDGSTTIFAGPRAKANPGAWGPNVNFKDGLYMTFDSSGQVQDVGARVETGSEINLGPAGGATFSGDSMNFSVVGALPSGSLFAS